MVYKEGGEDVIARRGHPGKQLSSGGQWYSGTDGNVRLHSTPAPDVQASTVFWRPMNGAGSDFRTAMVPVGVEQRFLSICQGAKKALANNT
jgi:hypothetical protein